MPDVATLRGTLIGSQSFETDHDGLAYAPRVRMTYLCGAGHRTVVPLHLDADRPVRWDCGVCGEVAHPDEDPPEGGWPDPQPSPYTQQRAKTHWEQLRLRRTEEELEALLQEALANYRRFGRSF